MLLGIGVGSFAWFAALSGVAGRFGRRLSDRHLRAVDALSGSGIAGFGGVLVFRALRAE